MNVPSPTNTIDRQIMIADNRRNDDQSSARTAAD
jgi:hypothetical protein